MYGWKHDKAGSIDDYNQAIDIFKQGNVFFGHVPIEVSILSTVVLSKKKTCNCHCWYKFTSKTD